MNGKILIITYDMIPYSLTWGGCQRMFYLANYLEGKGKKVDIVTCKKKEIGNFGNVLNANLIPIEYKGKFWGRFLKNSQLDISPSAKSEVSAKRKQSIAKKFLKSNIIYKILYRLDSFFFNEPNFMAGLISTTWISGIKKDLEEILNNKIYQAVIVSGPPFGLFRSLAIIKKMGLKSKVIIDYRDPWNLWKRGSKITLRREKKYLKLADEVVFTNNQLAKDMKKVFKLKNVSVISNGYSEENWVEQSEKKEIKDYLLVSFIGSICFDETGYIRNTDCLFAALEKFWNTGKKIVIEFVGVKNLNTTKIKELKKRYGEKVRFVGIVSGKESTLKMMEADVLLLLHTVNDNSSKYIISAKLYDYIRAQKYILNIGYGENNHSEIISKLDIGISVNNHERDILAALEKIYELYLNKNLDVNGNDYFEFSRDFQNEKYLKIVNG